MKKSKNSRISKLVALMMRAAICLSLLAGCATGGDDGGNAGNADNGLQPSENEGEANESGELRLTDGYFEAESDGLTWTCVLKENGMCP